MNKRLFVTVLALLSIIFTFYAGPYNITVAQEIPDGIETVVGKDGSLWERVNDFGFGSDANIGQAGHQPLSLPEIATRQLN